MNSYNVIGINVKLKKKVVGFEFSSSMHMYYTFDNYISSFSSMTTYVFLV